LIHFLRDFKEIISIDINKLNAGIKK